MLGFGTVGEFALGQIGRPDTWNEQFRDSETWAERTQQSETWVERTRQSENWTDR
jgi:hypothetical protein